jgi:menaquinol-cytochrome c reductase cytochrome b/c subunit
VACHGENGKGGTHGGAPLTPTLTRESIVSVLTTGRNDMPAFGTALSPEALQDLTAYVLELAAR